jgi:hypothetical protein
MREQQEWQSAVQNSGFDKVVILRLEGMRTFLAHFYQTGSYLHSQRCLCREIYDFVVFFDACTGIVACANAIYRRFV